MGRSWKYKSLFSELGTDNLLRLVYNDGVDNLNVISNPSTELSSSTWHHVALVKNGTNLKMYVDGSETHNGNFQ